VIHRIITPVVTIAIAATVAFAVARWQSPHASTTSIDTLKNSAWLATKLDLAEDQVTAIKALQTSFTDELSQSCEMQCSARFELGEAFFADAFTPEMEQAMVDKMAKAQASADLATLRHIRQIHALLNPEQQKVYVDLVSRCLCAECANGCDESEM